MNSNQIVRFLFLSLLLAFHLDLCAQKTITAEGTYVFQAPSDITLERAKITALERAKIQIIAEHFGTVVRMDNTTVLSNVNDESSLSLYSVSGSQVKGEWVSTIGEPVYDITYNQELEALAVSVTVKGVIREIVNASIPFITKTLRNGVEDRFESEDFRAGDNLFISFISPENGYLAIYLYDGTGVFRLLPLGSQRHMSVFPVTAGEKYVFFSDDENLTVECRGESELDKLYVIFSPKRFSTAVDEIPKSDEKPAFLGIGAFLKWLSVTRGQDSEMTVYEKTVSIRQ